VRLLVADGKLAPAAERQGQYDVVHLRLLRAAMRTKADWELVCRHVEQLLKPGGAVQWEEMSGGELTLFDANDRVLFTVGKGGVQDHTDEPVTALARIPRILYESATKHIVSMDAAALAPMLEGLGFHSTGVDAISSDNVPAWRKVVTLGMTQLSSSVAKRFAMVGKLEGATPQDVDELQTKADEEVEAGAYYVVNMYIVFGRKSKG